MCFGGDSGGDGGAQARADAQKQSISDATRQINAIFGLTDPSLYTSTRTVTDQIPIPSDDPNGPPQYSTQERQETYLDQPLLDTATKNKAAIDKTIGSTRDDILNYYKNQLNEQRDVTNRNISQQLAKQGLSGGSHQTDINSDLSKTYNDALLGFTNQADTSIANLENQDEQARLNLISQITSGADSASAIAAANAALANNAALASSSAKQGGVGNIFGNLAGLYNRDQQTQGQNAAYQRVITSLGLNPGTYSGSIVR